VKAEIDHIHKEKHPKTIFLPTTNCSKHMVTVFTEAPPLDNKYYKQSTDSVDFTALLSYQK
ncbi:uncharacterized protein METZ01_LOCUS310945, partial [marine metagenome]